MCFWPLWNRNNETIWQKQSFDDAHFDLKLFLFDKKGFILEQSLKKCDYGYPLGQLHVYPKCRQTSADVLLLRNTQKALSRKVKNFDITFILREMYLTFMIFFRIRKIIFEY